MNFLWEWCGKLAGKISGIKDTDIPVAEDTSEVGKDTKGQINDKTDDKVIK